MAGELDQHLANDTTANRKNGSSRKTVKTSSGQLELETPRDRNGSFEPQTETRLTDEMERKVLSLFALGNSYQNIREHLLDLYGMEVSNGTINAITDRLVPELKAWQEHDLEPVYPFVWLDAIHYKVKENGRFVSKALYTTLGLNIEGKKELLGLYISESEGARYWLNVLMDLNNRGVKDILIAAVDGLKGFPEAIETIFPETEVQLRVIHQIRNSMKCIASKNQKAFMVDLKCVYKAATQNAAEQALDELEAKWGMLLYAGMLKASEKWTHPVQNWNLTLSQLSIHFEWPD